MENPTAFDLNKAVRSWRDEFGVTGSISHEDLDELESHLRDHVASLHKSGFSFETAFSKAVEQIGTHHCLVDEFAKINPQRIWLERGMWMLAGIMLLGLLSSLSLIPYTLVWSLGLQSEWPLLIAGAAANLAQLSVSAMGATICWWLMTRQSSWGETVTRICVHHPMTTSLGLCVLLLGITPLCLHLTNHVSDWIAPFSEAISQHVLQVQVWGNVIGGVIQSILLGFGAVFLATRVRYTRIYSNLQRTHSGESQMHHFQSMERVLWMIVGIILHRILLVECSMYVQIPAALINSSFGGSLLAQHFGGILTSLLTLTLFALPIFLIWQLATRRANPFVWLTPAIRNHAWATAAVLTLALNFNSILWFILRFIEVPQLNLWLGATAHRWQIGTMWGLQIAQVLLLVLLLISRSRFHEANWWRKESEATSQCFRAR